MSIETVFGSAGHDHITGAQLARMIEGTVGKGDYVLRTQNELAATMQTANTVRIDTGDLVHDGRLATCERYTDLTVDSGVSGMKRNDLVVARFSKSSDQHQLVVVKGSPTAGEPTDPAVNDGAAGVAATADMPLWRVKLDGISPTLERVFDFAPTSTELRDSVYQQVGEGMAWGNLDVERLGCTVTVSAHMGWNDDVSPWSNRTCGTVPEGLRPKATKQVAGVHDGGSCMMSVEAGGAVKMVTRKDAFVGGGTFFAQAVYFVE